MPVFLLVIASLLTGCFSPLTPVQPKPTAACATLLNAIDAAAARVGASTIYNPQIAAASGVYSSSCISVTVAQVNATQIAAAIVVINSVP